MWHKIEHFFRWNTGICDAFYEGEKLMMSFLCLGCGKRSGIHPCDEIVDRELEKDMKRRVKKYMENYSEFLQLTQGITTAQAILSIGILFCFFYLLK